MITKNFIKINNKFYREVETNSEFDCQGCDLYNKETPCYKLAKIKCSACDREDNTNIILKEILIDK